MCFAIESYGISWNPSSTVPPNSSREAVGIVVQYKVKIRLILGFGLRISPKLITVVRLVPGRDLNWINSKLAYNGDVCLELPFILTHPNPESNPALIEGESGIPTDNLLDDFHFTETGRPGDDSSGGEGGGGGGVAVSVPPTPASLSLQPLSNGGPSASTNVSISVASTAVAAMAAASKPQMGLLAKRAAATNVNGSGSGMNGERKSPPHIAEFLRASEMPDGMAAFASPSPQPQQRSAIVDGGGAMTTSKEAVDALDNFLRGFVEPQQRPASSNGPQPQLKGVRKREIICRFLDFIDSLQVKTTCITMCRRFSFVYSTSILPAKYYGILMPISPDHVITFPIFYTLHVTFPTSDTNSLANGRCVQSSLSSSASPALMSSAMATSAIQQPSTANALVPRNLTPVSTVSPQKSQILDADDLIFEDFARLRLMEQQQKQQQQQQQSTPH
ncbi:hypothetical protein ACTXT7_012245 [Hymenolepis weldensis]